MMLETPLDRVQQDTLDHLSSLSNCSEKARQLAFQKMHALPFEKSDMC